MSNLFKTLELEAFRAGITPRTQQSRDWFRRKAQQLRRVNRNELMKEDPVQGGFLGLNLHYLPPLLRAKLLDGLLDTITDSKYTDKTKFNVTYSMLKRAAKMKYFKPCVKHYLNDHVRSRFARVPAPEWEIATFLPMADFQKAGKNKVYSDSRRMI